MEDSGDLGTPAQRLIELVFSDGPIGVVGDCHDGPVGAYWMGEAQTKPAFRVLTCNDLGPCMVAVGRLRGANIERLVRLSVVQGFRPTDTLRLSVEPVYQTDNHRLVSRRPVGQRIVDRVNAAMRRPRQRPPAVIDQYVITLS